MKPLAAHHQIHGVQPVLPVADVPAAVDWFCRALGFALDFMHGEPAFYARIKLGDRSWGDPIYIHLQLTDQAIVPCGETRLHVGHDIDGLHAHLLGCGARVVEPPTDRPWGLRELVLQTPDGHQLVLGAESKPTAAHDLARPVIACYRPKPGQDMRLLQLVRGHVPTLRRLGMATDSAPLIMRATDGTVVEAFEWRSAAAISAAHQHAEVLAMWADFGEACDIVKLGDLAETRNLFAEFSALDP